jgi:hypothetical protein
MLNVGHLKKKKKKRRIRGKPIKLNKKDRE